MRAKTGSFARCQSDTPPSRTACVAAFGDILHHGSALGLYIIEAMRQEAPTPSIELAYLGDEYASLASMLFEKDLGVVVHWLPARRTPLRVRTMDTREFFTFAASGEESACVLRPLSRVVQGICLADCMPAELVFLLVESGMEESHADVRRVVRSAVCRTMAVLCASGFHSGQGAPLARIYGMPWLKIAL
ncbi:hypothetical protein [Oceanidesulfovibrio marinus]|nr:hypothetical protein [Oceanidesulfovibrio marinus]